MSKRYILDEFLYVLDVKPKVYAVVDFSAKSKVSFVPRRGKYNIKLPNLGWHPVLLEHNSPVFTEKFNRGRKYSLLHDLASTALNIRKTKGEHFAIQHVHNDITNKFKENNKSYNDMFSAISKVIDNSMPIHSEGIPLDVFYKEGVGHPIHQAMIVSYCLREIFETTARVRLNTERVSDEQLLAWTTVDFPGSRVISDTFKNNNNFDYELIDRHLKSLENSSSDISPKYRLDEWPMNSLDEPIKYCFK